MLHFLPQLSRFDGLYRWATIFFFLQLNYSTLPQIPFSTLEWSHSLGAAVLMMNLRDEVGAPTVLRQRSARKRAARTGALGGALSGEMLGGVASASVPGSVRLRPFHEW